METLEALPKRSVQETLARANEIAQEVFRARKFGDVLRERELINKLRNDFVPEMEQLIANKEQELAEVRAQIAEREKTTTTETPEKVSEQPKNGEQVLDEVLEKFDLAAEREKIREEVLEEVSTGKNEKSSTVNKVVRNLLMAGVFIAAGIGIGKLTNFKKAAADVAEKPKTEIIDEQPAEQEEAEPAPAPNPEEITYADSLFETLPNRAHTTYEYFATKNKNFAIADKITAQIYVFNKKGRLTGVTPALFGKTLNELPNQAGEHNNWNHQATTPAGIYELGYFGITPEDRELYGQNVIRMYTDDVNLSIHETYPGEYVERKKRLDTPSAHDNFATGGCVNVDQFQKFFGDFEEGDWFIVLPDDASKTLNPETGGIINAS